MKIREHLAEGAKPSRITVEYRIQVTKENK